MVARGRCQPWLVKKGQLPLYDSALVGGVGRGRVVQGRRHPANQAGMKGASVSRWLEGGAA